MKQVFADTYYFVALLNPRDAAHEQAIQWTMAHRTRMITTAWVLTELGNYMCDPANRMEFVSAVRDLRANPQMLIVPAEESLFEAGLQLYATRPDKKWSVTDCISFVVMQRNGIAEALTGDHNFEQAGFTALLK